LFEAIKTRGVNQAQAVVSHLEASGCTLADVAPLLDYFDQNRDRFESPEGALYARLLSFDPGQSAGAGWVQFDPAKERERRRREDAAKAVSDAAAKRADKEALAAGRRRIDAQTPRLDRLTKCQRQHLEEIVEPNAWSRRRAPANLEKLCLKYLADHPNWDPPQLVAAGGAEGFEPL
jgi:hypothetical protein